MPNPKKQTQDKDSPEIQFHLALYWSIKQKIAKKIKNEAFILQVKNLLINAEQNDVNLPDYYAKFLEEEINKLNPSENFQPVYKLVSQYMENKKQKDDLCNNLLDLIKTEIKSKTAVEDLILLVKRLLINAGQNNVNLADDYVNILKREINKLNLSEDFQPVYDLVSQYMENRKQADLLCNNLFFLIVAKKKKDIDNNTLVSEVKNLLRNAKQKNVSLRSDYINYLLIEKLDPSKTCQPVYDLASQHMENRKQEDLLCNNLHLYIVGKKKQNIDNNTLVSEVKRLLRDAKQKNVNLRNDYIDYLLIKYLDPSRTCQSTYDLLSEYIKEQNLRFLRDPLSSERFKGVIENPISGLKNFNPFLYVVLHNKNGKELLTVNDDEKKLLQKLYDNIETFVDAASLKNAENLYETYCKSKSILNKIVTEDTYLIYYKRIAIEVLKELPKIYWPNWNSPENILANVFHEITLKKLKASPFQENLIFPLNQINIHPLIAYSGGFCHGLALQFCENVLKEKRVDRFNSVIKMFEAGKNMPKFERYQDSGHIPSQLKSKLEVIKNNNFKRAGSEIGLIEKDSGHYIDNCHLIVELTNCANLSAKAMAEKIATQVSDKLSLLDPHSNCAMDLGLRYHSNYMAGHEIGIAVKNKKYYFVDANLGAFEFDSLENLKDFIAWELYNMRYCHSFSEFQILNYPQLEEIAPTPKNLIAKKYQGSSSRVQQLSQLVPPCNNDAWTTDYFYEGCASLTFLYDWSVHATRSLMETFCCKTKTPSSKKTSSPQKEHQS